MVKKVISFSLALTLILSLLATQSFAKNDKEKTKDKVVDFYEIYEKEHLDYEKAMKKFLKKYPEVELVGSSNEPENLVTTAGWESGGIVYSGEDIIFDNDSQMYVYIGEYYARDSLAADTPDDHVSVFVSQDTDAVVIDQALFRGYDWNENLIARYDSETGGGYGPINLEVEATYGVDFVIDDYEIRSGVISAFLDTVPFERDGIEVSTGYGYNWSEGGVAGVGFSISFKEGFGFDISFHDDTNYSKVTKSPGVEF